MIVETVEDAMRTIGNPNYKNTALCRRKCRRRADLFIVVQVEHRRTAAIRLAAGGRTHLGEMPKKAPEFRCFAKDNMAKNSTFTIDNQSNKSYNKSTKEKNTLRGGESWQAFRHPSL